MNRATNVDGTLLKRIEEAKSCEDFCLAGLTHFSGEEHLVHHSVHLNYKIWEMFKES